MKFYVDNRTLFGFILVVLVIAALAAASAVYIQNLISISRTSVQSRQVILRTEQIRSGLNDLRLSFARQNPNPVSQEALLLNQSRNLTALLATDSLGVISDSIGRAVKKLITLLQTGPESSADAAAAKISAELDSIQMHENAAIEHRTRTASREYYLVRFTFITSLILLLAMLVLLVRMINKHLKGRLEAEEKLAVASARSHDLYENAPCGYFSFDRTGTVDSINSTLAAWLGLSGNEIIGRYKIDEFVAVSDSSLPDILTVLHSGKSMDNADGSIKRAGGTELSVMLNATALWSGNDFAGGRCTVIDSTEMKKAQAEIKRTNEELEAFSYSVSHDLRAPLRSIGGYSEILKEECYEVLPPEGKRAVDTVIRNASIMSNLIDDLLKFSRLSRREIVKTQTNMTDLVENILMEVRESTGTNAGISFNQLHDAEVDASMIRQVWINLVSNAVKYSSKKETPQIEIFSEMADSRVTYHVRDNGAGFNMAYYHKLFGVFQRLHKANDFEGTGVGLALSKRIVEKHNGTIWADSRLGEGATFSFSLPK